MKTLKARCSECHMVVAREIFETVTQRAERLEIAACPRLSRGMHETVVHMTSEPIGRAFEVDCAYVFAGCGGDDTITSFEDLSEPEKRRVEEFMAQVIAERRTPEQRIEKALEILEDSTEMTNRDRIHMAIAALK